MREHTGFTHGSTGMTATVTSVQRVGYLRADAPASFDVQYEIRDRDGKVVGKAWRQWSPPGEDADGNQVPTRVQHLSFDLEPTAQGNGFARAWNEQLEQTYRASGVREIHLTANEDVGGYAWAKQGFGWLDDGTTIADMAERLEQEIGNRPQGGDWSDADVREFRKLLKGLRSGDPGKAPTPLELAMVGWKPGVKMWPGKEFMLGASWEGVKKL